MAPAAARSAFILLVGLWPCQSLRLAEDLSSIAERLQDLDRISDTSSSARRGPPRHHVVSFDAGTMGLRVGAQTGRVEELRPDGDGAQKGVQVGWYIHAIDERYQFTPRRITHVANSGQPYTVVFSEADEPLAGCVNNASWVDSAGESCQTYEAKGWCRRWGEPTYDFKAAAHCVSLQDCDLPHFAVDGVSAREACCACGGGMVSSDSEPSPPSPTPEDPGDREPNTGLPKFDKDKFLWPGLAFCAIGLCSVLVFASRGPPHDDVGDTMSHLPTSNFGQTRTAPARPMQGQQEESLAPSASEAPRRMAPSATEAPQRSAGPVASEVSDDH